MHLQKKREVTFTKVSCLAEARNSWGQSVEAPNSLLQFFWH